MYKSSATAGGWELPHYAAVKDGPDMLSFTATVNVHGQLFGTSQPCKSSEDAQNMAARIAFEHLNSNPPTPSSGVCDLPPPQIQPFPPTLPLPPVPSSLPHTPPGVPWTEEEHRLFLLGLQKLGKGDWRGIARNHVISRTPTQVASHAQKHFIRQSNVSRRKRRSSLFDIVADEVSLVCYVFNIYLLAHLV